MKKRLPSVSAILISLLLLSLCACQRREEPTKAETELAFPCTIWNMSPKELTKALNLKAGSYRTWEEPYDAERKDPTGTFSIAVENWNVFGTDGLVGFRFCDFTGTGRYGLNYITVEYPEDADLASVKAAMISAYGESSTEHGSHMSGWFAETTQFDVLSEDQLQALPEEVLEYAKDSPLCKVYLSDGTDLKNSSFYIPPVHGIAFLSSLNHVSTW